MDKWNLIVDVARCENCHNCTLAVKDEYVDNAFPGYCAPQPRHGHEWIAIERKVRGSGTMVDTAYLPKMCNHCDEAPCMEKAGDCISKRKDGIVLIDPVKARGRRDLVGACPYGAIWWNEEEQLPQHWFFDAHLLDKGWKEPRCAQVCPTEAIKAIKVSDGAMADLVEKQGLEVLQPELGTKPRVYYANLHRFAASFLGGEVLSEQNGRLECVEGAAITLLKSGQEMARTTSDIFGNFKFDGLAPDGTEYELRISHEAGSAHRSAAVDDSVYLAGIVLG